MVNVATGVSVHVRAIVSELCALLNAHPSIMAEDVGEEQSFDVSHLRSILGRDPFANGASYQDILRRHVPQLADGLRRIRAGR